MIIFLVKIQPFAKYISQLLKQKEGVDIYVYTEGSNNITATARWTESEAQYRVDDLRETRGIKKSVQAKILPIFLRQNVV